MDSGKVNFENDSAGVVAPAGFCAAADSADVRSKGDSRLDTGILFSPSVCLAAAVFTRNAVKAAPVLECQKVLSSSATLHGIVVNSGNANACTGIQGKEDARRMRQLAEVASGVDEGSFLVCSTGRIGELLPMNRLAPAIERAAKAARDGQRSGDKFADCILTSDTRRKSCSAIFEHDGKTVTVGGVAKGAGMIQPNMATMLAFLTTDAKVSGAYLQSALARAVKTTFNAITVDGDMSTNDTVALLANGASSVSIESGCSDLFEKALQLVCDALAEKIVGDGERITKVVDLRIKGASSEKDAENVARAIGNSLLVKTSWYGNDPNWGRLMDALGYADAKINPDLIDISYDDTPAMTKGTPLPENKAQWKEVVSQRRFVVTIGLNVGTASYRLRASDLSEGYVNFNKSE